MKQSTRHLLVVEDDPGLQGLLRWCFEDFEVVVTGNRADAIAQVRRHQPSVVTLDLGLPPDPGGVSEGMATLEEIMSIAPMTKVIVVTGNDDRAHAVKAIELGAYDFYEKPIESDTLALVVGRAQRIYELEEENSRLQQAGRDSPLRGIISVSPQMNEVCRYVEKIAPLETTVLLLGDSGTGKELFARALHELSPRADSKMVAINCAAIPDTLLESELFGYEKGAFTGAAKQTRGKIEYADGGTLFLDEIGDLPRELQAKLLRFLQERVIERVGGREEIPVDVRIICATHQDLEGQIEEGRFRQDLFYRIREITIRIPPLRERDGDVLLLARAFLERFNRELGMAVRGFTPGAIAAMDACEWEGNVRELESRVKRAVIMAEDQKITENDLELDATEAPALPLNLKAAREKAERRVIQQALQQADGNIVNAAKLLGVTRPTLYRLIENYAIES